MVEKFLKEIFVLVRRTPQFCHVRAKRNMIKTSNRRFGRLTAIINKQTKFFYHNFIDYGYPQDVRNISK